MINTQNTGSIKQEQCLAEARNDSNKVVGQKTNINEGEQIFTVTSTVSQSSQNKGDQSGTSEKSSEKAQIQDFDGTDCHQMESVETEISQLKVQKPEEDIHKAESCEHQCDTASISLSRDFDGTDCHQTESVETEIAQLEVPKPEEDIHKADKGTPPLGRKTDGERNDDSTSVAQIEGCVEDIEDGEIVESTVKEDKINSKGVAEGNEKKERNTAERDSVKKLHSCLYN